MEDDQHVSSVNVVQYIV